MMHIDRCDSITCQLSGQVLQVCTCKQFVDRSSNRMPDSQSREPRFESPVLPFRSLGILALFMTPQFTQL